MPNASLHLDQHFEVWTFPWHTGAIPLCQCHYEFFQCPPILLYFTNPLQVTSWVASNSRRTHTSGRFTVYPRFDSRLAPVQWETSLQSNAVSHWLGSSLESALTSHIDRLVQKRHHSSGLAMELCPSCTDPSIWYTIRFFMDSLTCIPQGYFTGTGAKIAPVPVKLLWWTWVKSSE